MVSASGPWIPFPALLSTMATIRKKEESEKRMVCLAQDFLVLWVMGGLQDQCAHSMVSVCVTSGQWEPIAFISFSKGFPKKLKHNTRETAVLRKNCKQTYNVQKCFLQDLHLSYKLWVRNSKTDMCNSPQLVNGSDRTHSSAAWLFPLAPAYWAGVL